jgi:hypothetical protein
MLEGYKNNLHKEKYKRGGDFFDLVKGNSFRTDSEKSVELNELSDQLIAANAGWDNFYHEVPIIAAILTYIKVPKDLPTTLAPDLIAVSLKARIGRGTNYEGGVSPKGKLLYDHLFSIIGESFFPEIMVGLTTLEVRSKIRNEIAKRQLVSLLKVIKKNVVNERYLESLDYLINNIPSNSEAMLSKEFRKITSTFLNWN